MQQQPPPNYPPGAYYGWTPEMIEIYNYKQRAKEIATISLILAGIGLFFSIIGIILGPLAIKKAREAKGMLYPPRTGLQLRGIGRDHRLVRDGIFCPGTDVHGMLFPVYLWHDRRQCVGIF